MGEFEPGAMSSWYPKLATCCETKGFCELRCSGYDSNLLSREINGDVDCFGLKSMAWVDVMGLPD